MNVDAFGTTLRVAREHSGLSQQDLAALVGVTEMTLRSYEQGVTYPRLDRAVRLADAVGVELVDMIGATK